MPTTNPVPSQDPSDLLFNAGKLDEVVSGSNAIYTDRLGVSRRTMAGVDAAADLVLGGIGYAPPVVYASGISLTLTTQTVEYSGEVYAPKVANLPFTTSTWATDSAKFRLIQGVAATDLAASGGSSMIGYMPSGTGAVATAVQDVLRETVSVLGFYADGVSGAKVDPTGVVDSTAGIQAAINYAAPLGKSVFIPAGTYAITALTLPQQHGGIEIFGEAMNSMYNMENAIYRGSVLVSTQATGNIISCDGGGFYSNRGIRIRNLNMRVSTSGYAIYLKRSPELNLLENLTVYNDNSAGGSGVALESCWSGTRVNGCQFNAAAIGASNIGINVFNDIKAGGILIEDTNATKFAKGIRIGGDVYQATLRNSGGEGCTHGVFIDGNDPKVNLDTCHFEFNTDIAVFIEKSGGVVIKNSTFYRNAESAALKAEIYVASGGLNYNYNLEVSNCNFFGLGTNVTAIYISNPTFGSGVISNNVVSSFGTSTTGLRMDAGDRSNFTVVDNVFDGATTPYTYTEGYKTFNTGLSGNHQIRFSATPILSSDPNTLDDYEEGSWTPTLGGVGGQSGQVYGTRSGYYQKIGSRVYFTFSVTLTTKGSIGLEAVLSGLPFTIAGDAGYGSGFITDFENLGVSVSMISIVPDPNNTRYLFRRTTSASASMGYELGSNLFTDTTTIRGGGWYVTTA